MTRGRVSGRSTDKRADLYPEWLLQWLHANLSSHYSFLTTVHSALLALPSPMPRRGQKLSKSCFFEMRDRRLELQGALEDARAWLGTNSDAGRASDLELFTQTLPLIWRIKGQISVERNGE